MDEGRHDGPNGELEQDNYHSHNKSDASTLNSNFHYPYHPDTSPPLPIPHSSSSSLQGAVPSGEAGRGVMLPARMTEMDREQRDGERWKGLSKKEEEEARKTQKKMINAAGVPQEMHVYASCPSEEKLVEEPQEKRMNESGGYAEGGVVVAGATRAAVAAGDWVGGAIPMTHYPRKTEAHPSSMDPLSRGPSSPLSPPNPSSSHFVFRRFSASSLSPVPPLLSLFLEPNDVRIPPPCASNSHGASSGERTGMRDSVKKEDEEGRLPSMRQGGEKRERPAEEEGEGVGGEQEKEKKKMGVMGREEDVEERISWMATNNATRSLERPWNENVTGKGEDEEDDHPHGDPSPSLLSLPGSSSGTSHHNDPLPPPLYAYPCYMNSNHQSGGASSTAVAAALLPTALSGTSKGWNNSRKKVKREYSVEGGVLEARTVSEQIREEEERKRPSFPIFMVHPQSIIPMLAAGSSSSKTAHASPAKNESVQGKKTKNVKEEEEEGGQSAWMRRVKKEDTNEEEEGEELRKTALERHSSLSEPHIFPSSSRSPPRRPLPSSASSFPLWWSLPTSPASKMISLPFLTQKLWDAFVPLLSSLPYTDDAAALAQSWGGQGVSPSVLLCYPFSYLAIPHVCLYGCHPYLTSRTSKRRLPGRKRSPISPRACHGRRRWDPLPPSSSFPLDDSAQEAENQVEINVGARKSAISTCTTTETNSFLSSPSPPLSLNSTGSPSLSLHIQEKEIRKLEREEAEKEEKNSAMGKTTKLEQKEEESEEDEEEDESEDDDDWCTTTTSTVVLPIIVGGCAKLVNPESKELSHQWTVYVRGLYPGYSSVPVDPPSAPSSSPAAVSNISSLPKVGNENETPTTTTSTTAAEGYAGGIWGNNSTQGMAQQLEVMEEEEEVVEVVPPSCTTPSTSREKYSTPTRSDHLEAKKKASAPEEGGASATATRISSKMGTRTDKEGDVLEGEDYLSHFIEKVAFVLDRSFTPCIRTVYQPPFELTEMGWGEFTVSIHVHLRYAAWTRSSEPERQQLLHYFCGSTGEAVLSCSTGGAGGGRTPYSSYVAEPVTHICVRSGPPQGRGYHHGFITNPSDTRLVYNLHDVNANSVARSLFYKGPMLSPFLTSTSTSSSSRSSSSSSRESEGEEKEAEEEEQNPKAKEGNRTGSYPASSSSCGALVPSKPRSSSKSDMENENWNGAAQHLQQHQQQLVLLSDRPAREQFRKSLPVSRRLYSSGMPMKANTNGMGEGEDGREGGGDTTSKTSTGITTGNHTTSTHTSTRMGVAGTQGSSSAICNPHCQTINKQEKSCCPPSSYSSSLSTPPPSMQEDVVHSCGSHPRNSRAPSATPSSHSIESITGSNGGGTVGRPPRSANRRGRRWGGVVSASAAASAAPSTISSASSLSSSSEVEMNPAMTMRMNTPLPEEDRRSRLPSFGGNRDVVGSGNTSPPAAPPPRTPPPSPSLSSFTTTNPGSASGQVDNNIYHRPHPSHSTMRPSTPSPSQPSRIQTTSATSPTSPSSPSSKKKRSLTSLDIQYKENVVVLSHFLRFSERAKLPPCIPPLGPDIRSGAPQGPDQRIGYAMVTKPVVSESYDEIVLPLRTTGRGTGEEKRKRRRKSEKKIMEDQKRHRNRRHQDGKCPSGMVNEENRMAIVEQQKNLKRKEQSRSEMDNEAPKKRVLAGTVVKQEEEEEEEKAIMQNSQRHGIEQKGVRRYRGGILEQVNHQEAPHEEEVDEEVQIEGSTAGAAVNLNAEQEEDKSLLICVAAVETRIRSIVHEILKHRNTSIYGEVESLLIDPLAPPPPPLPTTMMSSPSHDSAAHHHHHHRRAPLHSSLPPRKHIHPPAHSSAFTSTITMPIPSLSTTSPSSSLASPPQRHRRRSNLVSCWPEIATAPNAAKKELDYAFAYLNSINATAREEGWLKSALKRNREVLFGLPGRGRKASLDPARKEEEEGNMCPPHRGDPVDAGNRVRGSASALHVHPHERRETEEEEQNHESSSVSCFQRRLNGCDAAVGAAPPPPSPPPAAPASALDVVVLRTYYGKQGRGGSGSAGGGRTPPEKEREGIRYSFDQQEEEGSIVSTLHCSNIPLTCLEFDVLSYFLLSVPEVFAGDGLQLCRSLVPLAPYLAAAVYTAIERSSHHRLIHHASHHHHDDCCRRGRSGTAMTFSSSLSPPPFPSPYRKKEEEGENNPRDALESGSVNGAKENNCGREYFSRISMPYSSFICSSSWLLPHRSSSSPPPPPSSSCCSYCGGGARIAFGRCPLVSYRCHPNILTMNTMAKASGMRINGVNRSGSSEGRSLHSSLCGNSSVHSSANGEVDGEEEDKKKNSGFCFPASCDVTALPPSPPVPFPFAEANVKHGYVNDLSQLIRMKEALKEEIHKMRAEILLRQVAEVAQEW